MIKFVIAAAAALAQPADTTYEGKWFVSDDTDNNTGERKVYAFRVYLKPSDPDYVTLTMRCTNGKPTFFVDWDGFAFPDETVLTIGPVNDPDAEPNEKSYVFEKSTEISESGLRASPEISASIIAALGKAKYATVTAHLASGSRTVGVEIDGTQRAWDRVSRHCPVQIMPRPPL
ncbi:hypothetical protein ABIC78_002616 [Novosphingobium sp. 1529]|uniref:hypothetical protein n=1 Tax=Novosphingobium sp. 1529 TaxID=3156424 RepID=UPI0033920C8E